MKAPFEDLRITGLLRERSYIIEAPILRIYFQLSEPPPLGWSYMFTAVWREVLYAAKRPAGVEGDAIWIDCVPEEVKDLHLSELERAVAQTNVNYESHRLKSTIAKQHKKALDSHSRARLDELGRSLDPDFDSSTHTDGGPRFAIAAAVNFMKRALAALTRKD
jgi:hypothetical protein